MKLLVTGGAGYIGGVVVRHLLGAGHQVEILDDLSTGHASSLPLDVRFHQRDIHDVGRILTPSAHFDGVLHFAGKIAVGESVERPDIYWHANVSGSLALLRAIREAKTTRLIFSSTGSMYAATDDKITETDPIRPQNPYATSKFVVDTAIAEYAEAFGFSAVSLRYFNAAGAWQDCGEKHDPETHLIPIALQVADRKREKLEIFGDDYETPDGTCVRDYVHVADLATAHLAALEAMPKGRHTVYNLGNGNGYSNKEVAAAVSSVSGVDFPVSIVPRRSGDPAVVVAASRKAKEELGWEPARPRLEDIVRDAWNFYRHGNAQGA